MVDTTRYAQWCALTARIVGMSARGCYRNTTPARRAALARLREKRAALNFTDAEWAAVVAEWGKRHTRPLAPPTIYP